MDRLRQPACADEPVLSILAWKDAQSVSGEFRLWRFSST
jgi:hypothetical protein